MRVSVRPSKSELMDDRSNNEAKYRLKPKKKANVVAVEYRRLLRLPWERSDSVPGDWTHFRWYASTRSANEAVERLNRGSYGRQTFEYRVKLADSGLIAITPI